jgi:hypothetical protein
MAASKTIGGINVTISATIDKFRKNITAARKMLTGFTASIKGAIFSLKGLATALTVGAFVKFTANAFTALDALADSADKLNITTGALAGFRMAADQAGVSTAVLEKGLVTLSVKTGKRADTALFDLIDKSSKLTTEQERLALAVQTFGTRGASMVNILRMTRPELEKLVQFTNDVGYGMSKTVAIGVGRAVDAFGKLKIAVKGVFFSVAAELAPYIEVLSNKLSGFLASGGKAKGLGKSIADAIIATTRFVSDGVAKMVSAMLNAAAALIDIPNQLSGTRAGNAFGFEFSKSRANSAEEMRYRAGVIDRNMPSKFIDKGVVQARKQATKQAAAAPATNGSMGGLLGGMLSKAGSGLVSSMANSPIAMYAKVEMAKMALGFKAQMFAANMAGKKPQGITPGFAFAESGSADSYRQQAAIRRQGDQIGKKQLTQQTLTRIAVEKIAKRPPMEEADL